MYAVIFEVEIKDGCQDEYLRLGAEMRKKLNHFDGFISAERFCSVVTEGKICSLSFWESEAGILQWKKDLQHMTCQQEGKGALFRDYRIRIAKVERDYQMQQV